MKLKDARAIPLPPVWSGHTDADILKEVERYFPAPGPLLRTLIHRFKVSLEAHEGSVSIEDLQEATAECPACGTALKVDHA